MFRKLVLPLLVDFAVIMIAVFLLSLMKGGPQSERGHVAGLPGEASPVPSRGDATRKPKPDLAEVLHATAPQGTGPTAVSYKGKVRDSKWLELMYGRFKDKIALVGGRFIDVGGANLWADGGVAIGQGRRVLGSVRQVLDSESFLLELFCRARAIDLGDSSEEFAPSLQPPNPEVARVKGISTREFVDGQIWKGRIAAVGTFRYTTAMGSSKTVKDFLPLADQTEILTRAQFVQALAEGYELGEWKPTDIYDHMMGGTRVYWKRIPFE